MELQFANFSNEIKMQTIDNGCELNWRRRLLLFSLLFSLVSLWFGLEVFLKPGQVLAAEPSLKFDPASKTVAVGRTFTADISINTVGQWVAGAGAQITYEPAIVSVVSIEPGTIFGDYPIASFNNSRGRMSISGIVSTAGKLFSGSGVFATVSFKGEAIGKTRVEFIFEPGSTRDSNIAVTYGSGDILGEVQGLEVNVVAPGTDSGGDSSEPLPTEAQPIEVEPNQTPEEEEDFFSWLLRKLGFKKEPIEDGVTREARPTSEPLDPHAPLPSQPPITDPGQEQPEAQVPNPQTRYSSLAVALAFLGGFLIPALLIGGVYWWRRRKKEEE